MIRKSYRGKPLMPFSAGLAEEIPPKTPEGSLTPRSP